MPLVAWLAELEQQLEFRWPPHVILECEGKYPGLMNELATYLWQQRLIRMQLEGTGVVSDG